MSTSIVIEWYTSSFARRTEKSPRKKINFYFENYPLKKTYTSDWMKLTFKDKNRNRMKGVKLPILCMTDWRWRSIRTWLFRRHSLLITFSDESLIRYTLAFLRYSVKNHQNSLIWIFAPQKIAKSCKKSKENKMLFLKLQSL